jgi:hypothetical protein
MIDYCSLGRSIGPINLAHGLFCCQAFHPMTPACPNLSEMSLAIASEGIEYSS